MGRTVAGEILDGFMDEARSYLPSVRAGIAAYIEDASELEPFRQAYRHTHTIKGAAAMIGLTSLSHMAFYLEELLEDALEEELAVDRASGEKLTEIVDRIEDYLDQMVNGQPDEIELLSEVLLVYRRLRELPESEDSAELEKLIDGLQPEAQEEQVSVKPPLTEAADAELMEAFAQEAEDHLLKISTNLAALEKDPDNRELIQEIRRPVHTLKGAAGAVGFSAIAQLSHRMEDLLDTLYDGERSVDSQITELLFSSVYLLEDLTGQKSEADELEAALQELRGQFDRLLGGQPVVDFPDPVLEPAGSHPFLNLPDPRPKEPTSPPTYSPSPAEETVRVPLERLDDLVRLVSELVINRSVFEQRVAEYVGEVEELKLSIERLRRVSSQLETQYEVSALGGGKPLPTSQTAAARGPTAQHPRTAEFDELEFDRYTEFHLLSRELAEASLDVRTVGSELGALIGKFDAILNRQRRLSTEMQDKLMRARMVPLATLSGRLHRAVRVLARQQGKPVDLMIEGEGIELDKAVLEDMADPLLHLVRNAVDHGIEAPEIRQALGKPAQATIRLRADQVGNEVVLRVSDDGAGLEPKLVRAVALERGDISEAQAQQMPDEELYELIFRPGFSTAGEVSEVSGRGVGLDVVRTNVLRQKGSIALESRPGQGMSFTIRLPVTLAITRALLVQTHGETFAIPLGAVTQLLRIGRSDFERIGQEAVVRSGNKVFPRLSLAEALGLGEGSDESLNRLPVLILAISDQQIALVVDRVLGGREIVVKSLGSHLRGIHGVAGATIMGDGAVVLIINPADLVSKSQQSYARSTRPSSLAVHAHPLSVMIVDDSLSVRRVVSNLLRGAGWHAIAAKDGLEALEILQQSPRRPDLILVDIEMPRMDGYELMSTLRAQEAYRDLPLVVLTSRAGDKHRQKAMDAGASDFVVKPYQDELLLGLIRRLAGAVTDPVAG